MYFGMSLLNGIKISMYVEVATIRTYTRNINLPQFRTYTKYRGCLILFSTGKQTAMPQVQYIHTPQNVQKLLRLFHAGRSKIF